MRWNERVKELMKSKNINQKQLSEQSGITEASVSRYLNGERTPRIDIVSNFAKVFGVTVDEIIADEFTKMSTYDSIANAIARDGGQLTEAEKEKLISLLRGD
ncbi:MAG: helix-turn-helix transcriptional regulator, partial [Erysipelotrichaceae bacterium]|nr:helix-turn-helix transcriptional regulator [Erysipelotrichaceae bacterium]